MKSLHDNCSILSLPHKASRLSPSFLNKIFGKQAFAVGFAAALALFAPGLASADYKFSENTTLSANFTDTGTVTIASGVTVDTNGFAMTFANIGTTGTITNSSVTQSVVTMNNSASINSVPQLTGNIEFHQASTGLGVINRYTTTNQYTGDTYLDGGRMHLTNGTALGTGTLYLNGNLVNNSTGGINPIISNNVAVNGANASIRAAYGGSITFNGIISDAPGMPADSRLTIGALESGSNKYILNGANTYTVPVYMGDSEFSGATQYVTLGNNTALGTGNVNMVSNAAISLKAAKLANDFALNGKALTITNDSNGAATISSDFTGTSGSKLTINTSNQGFTFSGSISGGTPLSIISKSGTVFTTGKFTGTGSVSYVLAENASTTYNRVRTKDNTYSGGTFLTGGATNRIHVQYGSAFGTGTINLNANLCNDNIGSYRRVTFDQDIVVSGADASFRVAYCDSDSNAYMRVNGDISSSAETNKLTFNQNESGAGVIFLYGDNRGLTCPTATSNTASSRLVLGTDTALGDPAKSTLTVNGDTRLMGETNAASDVRTIGNNIIVNNKILRFENVSTTFADNADGHGTYTQTGGKGTLIVNSDISGNAASVYFGSQTPAMNTGTIVYGGVSGTETAPINAVVAASSASDFAFTTQDAQFFGNLTLDDSVTYLMSDVYGQADVSGTATIFNVDANLTGVSGGQTFLTANTVKLDTDSTIKVYSTSPIPVADANLVLFSADSITDQTGTALTPEALSSMIDLTDLKVTFGGYTPELVNGKIQLSYDHAAVPEPATWVLLVLGGLGVVCLRRKNGVRE